MPPSPVLSSEDEGDNTPERTPRRVKKRLGEMVVSDIDLKNPPPDTGINETTDILATAHLARAPANSQSTLPRYGPPDEFLFSSDWEERMEESFDEWNEEYDQLERDSESLIRKPITVNPMEEADGTSDSESPQEAIRGVPCVQSQEETRSMSEVPSAARAEGTSTYAKEAGLSPADSSFVPADAPPSHFLRCFFETGRLFIPKGARGCADASDFIRRVRLLGRVPDAIADLWKTRNVPVPDGCRSLHNRNAKLRNKTLVIFERGGGTREELNQIVMAQLGKGPRNPSLTGTRPTGRIDPVRADALSPKSLDLKETTTLTEPDKKLKGGRRSLGLETGARQRERDQKEGVGEWNRKVPAPQVKDERNNPMECTGKRDQWGLNHPRQRGVPQTNMEELKPTSEGRQPEDTPAHDGVGKGKSLAEVAQIARHFKQTENKLAQRRQRLVDELRRNDALTQRTRENRQRWKRSLESEGRPFTLITPKRKDRSPVREAKIPRPNDPQTQVMQITPRDTAYPKKHPETWNMGSPEPPRTAFPNFRVHSSPNVPLDNNRTHAYVPTRPGTPAATLWNAGKLRTPTRTATFGEPATKWHDYDPYAQYERELEADHDTTR